MTNECIECAMKKLNLLHDENLMSIPTSYLISKFRYECRKKYYKLKVFIEDLTPLALESNVIKYVILNDLFCGTMWDLY